MNYPELDQIIKTEKGRWPHIIFQAESCAYNDTLNNREEYVKTKTKYVQYVLDKMIEEYDRNSYPI